MENVLKLFSIYFHHLNKIILIDLFFNINIEPLLHATGTRLLPPSVELPIILKYLVNTLSINVYVERSTII